MKIRSRWVPKVTGLVLSVVLRVWFATCRKVYIAVEPRTRLCHQHAPDDDERFILCVWHDAVLVPIFSAPPANRRETCCLVSQHQDGSFLAEAMRWLGYSTVRGSSKRGGAQAVRQLMDETAGKHIVISPDGPRGPRRQIKAGAVYLASQTGRRIIAGGYGAKRYWRIKGSWTDLLLPMPFTALYVVTGEPIAVPPDLSRDELDSFVDRAQRSMTFWTDYAERLARGETVELLEEAAATATAPDRNRSAA